MGLFKFLKSLRTLANNKNITIEEAYKFAKQEFGEVSDLLKLQINKIFKDVEAPSIKLPKKPEGKVIEASFKPGMDKTGKVVEESPSQLMQKLESKVEDMKNPFKPKAGLNLAEGLTRTSVRTILDKSGIKVPDKADPIEVFRKVYGQDSLGDVANISEELIELERMGKSTKSLDQVLEQEGMFDLPKRKNPPQGLTDEEMAQLNKEIDQENILKKFDPEDREPNAVGGRVGFAIGSLPKGIQALAKQLNKKFGKGTIKTADEIDRPQFAKDKEMFEKFESRNPDPKRKLTDEEIEMYEEELGDSETWMSSGTVEEAEQALKRQKEYQQDMFTQYKAGKLNPEPGEKGRKEFLEQKLQEMEMSGDKKLMTRDEIEELSTFDLGTEMEQMRNKEIKEGVADVMRDTSPAGLEKSLEVDDLMLKYPGISRDLAKQIANDPDPERKAQVISMIEQTFKMDEMGMSGDEIIDTFKKGTDRTKQAGGGLAYLMGL
jgi:tetratricopeptide (TPR) repeat protein